MNFTVHLRGEDDWSADFSIRPGLYPMSRWIKGTEQLLNLNPHRPDLRPGSVAKLIEQEGLEAMLSGPRHAVVLVHPGGPGSLADLATLQLDLLMQGFRVTIKGEIEWTDPHLPAE
jgi:hypothetical protein